MKTRLARLIAYLEAEDDPAEPRYDPVHLGAALIACLVVAGALFWLLWTLLVYEGGLPAKLAAAAELWLTPKTAADMGWRGWQEPGVFEGLVGNLLALAGVVAAVVALERLYRRGRR